MSMSRLREHSRAGSWLSIYKNDHFFSFLFKLYTGMAYYIIKMIDTIIPEICWWRWWVCQTGEWKTLHCRGLNQERLKNMEGMFEKCSEKWSQVKNVLGKWNRCSKSSDSVEGVFKKYWENKSFVQKFWKSVQKVLKKGKIWLKSSEGFISSITTLSHSWIWVAESIRSAES